MEETKELFKLGPDKTSDVLQRLWDHTGEELRSFDDVGEDIPGVIGYSRFVLQSFLVREYFEVF